MKIKLEHLLNNINEIKNYNYIVYPLPIDSDTYIELAYSEDVKEYDNIIHVDIFKKLIYFYKNDRLNSKEHLKFLSYYLNNLQYYPNNFINDLKAIDLIKNIDLFNLENNFYIQNVKDIYSPVKIIWLPWEDPDRQKNALILEEKIFKAGYKQFENYDIIKECKETYESLLVDREYLNKDVLLTYLVLFWHINDYYADNDTIEDLNYKIENSLPIDYSFWNQPYND